MKLNPETTFTQDELNQAFPDIDPGFLPLGSRVIVQLRSAKTTTKSGIILSDDTRETEKWNTQIAKVRALGPVAFRNRDTLQSWREGRWAEVGEYVRIPKFNQDKWEIEVDCGEKSASGQPVKTSVLFMMVNDLDLLGLKTGNPLEVKAYI